MNNSIEVSALSKEYSAKNSLFSSKKASSFWALRNLNFTIAPGELVAFLGPNGAGKSTTIKTLCGIVSPSSGQAKILGKTAGTSEANRELGLVFGTRSQLFLHMTVEQSLDLVAEIYFVSGKEKKKRIEELSELFEIKPFLKNRVRTLSLGERMRCEVVAALVHKPKILLADEPTIGLDIVAKNKLRTLIKAWQAEEKTTLMLTSHDLSDVEALCERCILIDKGEVQYDGKLQQLKGELSDLRRMKVSVANAESKALISNPLIIKLDSSNEFEHCYEVRTKKIPITDTLSALSKHYGDTLQDIQISAVSLEEVLHGLFHKGKAP